MDDPLLQLGTRGVFILVFCLTLLDFLRSREIPRLEVAALFGGLALVIAQQSVSALTGSPLPAWTATLSAVALMAQPYLLLRVLAQFESVPRYQQVLALIGLAASSALLLFYGSDLPVWASLTIVVAFAYVEGYATVEFVRSAVKYRGMTQWRLIAIALGSGCLAAAIAVSGVLSAVASLRTLTQETVDLLALGSAVAYYVGMAPPAWLRRIWEGAEVRRFLVGLSGLSGTERVASTLDYLGPAAARATGGSAAIVGIARDDEPGVLDLYSDARGRAALRETGIDVLTLERSPALSSASKTRACVAVGSKDDWGWELRALGEALHARGALLAPLVAGEHRYGLFVVFVSRASLFVNDDLAVLSVLAEQAALALEGGTLVEEITRERSTLSAVMSSMHEGLLVTDEAATIRYCNGRTAELLGVSRDKLIGIPVRSVFAQVVRRVTATDTVVTQWKQAVRNPDKRTVLDVELIDPPRSLQAEVFKVADAAGAQRGVGVVLRDVTAERDLARTKDELVSVVSHELRTPLASVVGFAELLRTRELTEAQRHQFLTVILEEGRRLTALINDFLDLQRMESGRQEITLRPLDLPELLDQSVSAAGPDDAHPIVLDLPDDLPMVRADSDRVRQVVANLLSNARKYSPGGGRVEVSAHEADGQVIISVQDHGLGLPPDAVPHLFEKFFRVDNSDRRSITGTGLGLAISRKIIDAHGGRIWAESEGLGHGSRFSFSLPVANAQRAFGDVLIVEDDAGFARLLEAEFANREISTVWAASAEEAAAQLASQLPKAVILDLLLPGAQGEEFLRGLNQLKGYALPVIVVTVKDLTQSERIALGQLHVQAILRKEPEVGAAAADLVESLIRRTREVAA